jgi:hypothetical protein
MEHGVSANMSIQSLFSPAVYEPSLCRSDQRTSMDGDTWPRRHPLFELPRLRTETV